jgi:hypothetical protein
LEREIDEGDLPLRKNRGRWVALVTATRQGRGEGVGWRGLRGEGVWRSWRATAVAGVGGAPEAVTGAAGAGGQGHVGEEWIRREGHNGYFIFFIFKLPVEAVLPNGFLKQFQIRQRIYSTSTTTIRAVIATATTPLVMIYIHK